MKNKFKIIYPGLLLLLMALFSCHQPNVVPTIHPAWSFDATIYEVNVRQFTPEGTFKALEEHLPRLQAMGVKILWLMPIHPIGEKNRKGSLGSYYAVKDYLGINPGYGTKEDLRHLVNQVHEQGMYVIIDWVANHTAWDNPLITEHPEWYMHDSAGAIISPVPDWTDVAGLDYTNKDLWLYMTNALQYWVREFRIDGYRCDVAGMLPVAYWNQAVPELKKIKDIFMLAEWETPEMHDTAFDATYSWDFYHLMNQIAINEQPISQIDTLLQQEDTTYPPHAFRMRFTTNHDENSWNGTEFERLGDGAQAFSVLTFTIPGIPLIYTGQEAALAHRLSFFEKDSIDWDGYSLEGFFTTLAQLKQNHPVLNAGEAGGAYQRIHTSCDSSILVFTRTNTDDQVLVMLNLSPEARQFDLQTSTISGNWKEIFTGAPGQFDQSTLLTMAPWEYHVYIKP